MTTPAALASVGDVAVLSGFEPAWPSAQVVGPAFTVQGGPGDNLGLQRLTTGVDVETRNGRYVLNDEPGHGFELDEDAVARAHERWQRDGAYNTIESVAAE